MFNRKKQLPAFDEPKYYYMVGLLVGASEMLSSYMKLHGDEKAQGMANRVDAVLEYFDRARPTFNDDDDTLIKT